jgi:transposase-like protein
MSDTFSKVEVISSVARRRRFSTELKLAAVAETPRRCSPACRSAMLLAATEPGVPCSAGGN